MFHRHSSKTNCTITFFNQRDSAHSMPRRRIKLCDLFDELGPSAPTLLEGWTAHDLAAHIVLRERDLIAGPCIVLPGPFQLFAERRRVRLAKGHDFGWLVARIPSGPPPGFFRIGQRIGDLRRQPGQLGHLAQHPAPACDTTPWPSADTFTRETAALLFTCEVPSVGIVEP
jgi:hypothetical protein